MSFTTSNLLHDTSLSGKNILITGACGRIGSSVLFHCISAGANVVATDINSTELDNIVASNSLNTESIIHSIAANLSQPDEIERVVQESVKYLKKIDGVVHCAYPRTKSWGTRFEDLNAEDLGQNLNMQLGGAILFSQSVMRCFVSQGYGNLVHISSVMGVQSPKFDHYRGTNMYSPIEYSAIKAGIITITKWLAKYFANNNIRINCVSPGGILDSQPPEFLQRYRDSCTNFGMLSADQVSSVVLFLLSPASEAVNGQNIVIDDGWCL